MILLSKEGLLSRYVPSGYGNLHLIVSSSTRWQDGGEKHFEEQRCR